MKRITICLLLVLLSTGFVCAEVTVKKVSNADGTTDYIFYDNGKEVARESWGNDGSTKVTGKIPDGVVSEYYENGKLKGEATYKDGKLEGMRKIYNMNGKLRLEWNYKNGICDGVHRTYFESGGLRTEWNYKNGKIEGMGKEYYENGGIHWIETYKNGKLTHRKEYDEKGNLKSEKDYPIEKKDKK